MHKLLLAIAVLFAAALAAPAYAGDGEVLGTLMGAGIGGFVGSEFGHGSGRVAATTLGVLGGGWIGHDLGRAADQASYGAPPYYASSYAYMPPVAYYNSYTPNYVAPPAPPSDPPVTYLDSVSQGYCREFSQVVQVNGRAAESYGTACLQPDGSWRVVQ